MRHQASVPSDGRSQRERMLAGELYIADDPQLAADSLRALTLTRAFNASDPADADALQRAGWPSASDQFENSIALAHPKLLFLGDVFAVPSWVPFANVFSIGDVLLVLGGIAVVHRLCGSRLAGWHPIHPQEPMTR